MADRYLHGSTQIDTITDGSTSSTVTNLLTNAGKGGTSLQPTDIVDNLTSTASNKVLSAAQGKVLDEKISAIPIPVVNDGVLTIQKNGTNIETFSANSLSNKTANIIVPTKTSDITNDSDFITSSYHDETKEDADATILKQANVVDDVHTTSAVYPLSANMGYVLYSKINAIEGRGRYLTTFDASNGQPSDLPTDIATTAYNYKTGDYFIVKTAGSKVPKGTYIPVGTTTSTFPSESGVSSSVNDTIYFNGSTWSVLHAPEQTVTFSSITGQPSDNTNLAGALGDKLDKNTATSNQVYAHQSGGTNNPVTYTSGATANSIMYRTTGGVTSVGTPTADAHATTKKYVDDAVGSLLPKSGGTMTGGITFTSQGSMWNTSNIKDTKGSTIGFNTAGQIGINAQTDSSTIDNAFTFRIAGNNKLRIGNTNIRPETTNSFNCGTSSAQWNGVYGKKLYENGTDISTKYYLATNPSGYITSSALSGYATQSWVGQYYRTSSAQDTIDSTKLTGTKFYATDFDTYIPYTESKGENTNPNYVLTFINNNAANGLTYSSMESIFSKSGYNFFANRYVPASVTPSSAIKNGFYYVSSSTSGLSGADANPFLQYHSTQNDFKILTTAYSDAWLQQIATDFRSENIYYRRKENGVWKDWKKIANDSEKQNTIEVVVL